MLNEKEDVIVIEHIRTLEGAGLVLTNGIYN